MHVDDGAAECFACVFQVHCLFRRLRRAESHSGLPSQCARVSLRPSHIDANRPRRPSASAQSITDRKSTRLNSSHLVISYAVFCLKKKKRTHDHLSFIAQCMNKLHAIHHTYHQNTICTHLQCTITLSEHTIKASPHLILTHHIEIL